MKILITGGHHNSALTIAHLLLKKKYQLAWVGQRYTMVGDKHDSLEYQEVTQSSIPFINSLAGKFHPKAHALHLFKLPLGFIQAFYIIKTQKPNLVLSFGSYISVPICLIARFFKIPIIVFEQTSAIGRANQLLSRFAICNFLTWNSSLPYFPQNTSQVVGLPLPVDFFKKPKKRYFIKSKKPTLLITGGKQGSHIINQTILAIAQKLLTDFNIIHQTGLSQKTKDFQAALNLKNHLKPQLATAYIIKPHFTSSQMHTCLKQADLVISRSGAHITYELLSLGKPAILIPLPFAYRQEQLKNAHQLSKLNLAFILPQDRLTPSNLYDQIYLMKKQLKVLRKIGKTYQKTLPHGALKKILKYILKHFPK